MNWSRLAVLMIAVSLCACASNEAEETPTDSGTDTGSSVAVSQDEAAVSSAARTERRLQLERALDQWWLAFQRQEFSKADGVASALENYVNESYDEVVADLKTASPRFRKVSAAALGFSGKSEAVPHLVESLRDPFADVVFGALLSLWRMSLQGEADAIPAPEITPFLAHADPGIRSNAAMVLAHSAKPGQGELFLPLTAAMEDADPTVRVHAAAALGALGDADAIPFLVKGLTDEKPLVRIRASYALGRIGDRRACGPLIKRLDDPDEDVSKAAYKALKTITGQNIPRIRAEWQVYHDNATD